MIDGSSPRQPQLILDDQDQQLDAYQYSLPAERIAQDPAVPRDSSRLLVVDAPQHQHHQIFRSLPQWLKPGDLLITNNTRVIPARLYGRKPGGAVAEVLLLEPRSQHRWLALVKPGRRLKPGAEIYFGPAFATADPALPDEQPPQLIAKILDNHPATGGREIEFTVPSGEALMTVIERLGQMPLPPYITTSQADPEQYQTVYAARPGAVAAPTAGLHFTPELFESLAAAGIQRAELTLHVGVGTFRPVETANITDHTMHGEWIEVPAETVAQVQRTRAAGGRVIAVGTTAVRALEGAAAQTGELQPFQGKTNLFIYPGYRWRVVDGLITNFHLPGSSLLMLVSALVGRQRLLDLYQIAIEQQYRFYSFGDAMLLLPEAKPGA
jgi:S-adenosylmethionine:tRNA ribosyltransferase-isomerase